MTSETFAFLLIGAAAGGFINGLSGTGTALFALGFYLVVLDPISAVAIVAIMAVLTGLQGLWMVRHEVRAQPRRMLQFMVPGLVGVPIGLLLLEMIDASVLRIAIATFLIIYGIYFGFRASLPAFERRTPIVDAIVGLLGGILGGAASVSGAILQMWLSIRPWTKQETRAVLQPFNVAILGTTVILLIFRGAYNQSTLAALVVTVPAGLVAAQIGAAVFKRLRDTTFRRLLILLTLAMGIGILFSEIM